jgi:hypothetical protein
MTTPLIYGNPASDAERVYIYGNCQTVFLAPFLAAANDRYQYVCVLNHSEPGTPLFLPEEKKLEQCAFYLEQYDGRSEEHLIVRNKLRSVIPPDCPKRVFPSFFLYSLWPFDCFESRNSVEIGFPWGRYPYGDRVAMEVAESGLKGATAYTEYMRRAALQMPDIRQVIVAEMERIVQRDAKCDIPVGDYVQDVFRQEHAFWTTGHVSLDAIEVLAERLYETLWPILGGDRQEGRRNLHAAKANLPPMGSQQVPIHPFVAEAADLKFWHPDLKYSWFNNLWTFEEYMLRYISYDRSWQIAALP